MNRIMLPQVMSNLQAVDNDNVDEVSGGTVNMKIMIGREKGYCKQLPFC